MLGLTVRLPVGPCGASSSGRPTTTAGAVVGRAPPPRAAKGADGGGFSKKKPPKQNKKKKLITGQASGIHAGFPERPCRDGPPTMPRRLSPRLAHAPDPSLTAATHGLPTPVAPETVPLFDAGAPISAPASRDRARRDAHRPRRREQRLRPPSWPPPVCLGLGLSRSARAWSR